MFRVGSNLGHLEPCSETLPPKLPPQLPQRVSRTYFSGIRQLVNVHHVSSLHVDHQVPGVGKRHLAGHAVKPLGSVRRRVWKREIILEFFVIQFNQVKSCDVEPDLVVVQVTLVLFLNLLLTTRFLPGCLSTALFRAN